MYYRHISSWVDDNSSSSKEIYNIKKIKEIKTQKKYSCYCVFWTPALFELFEY